MIVGCSHVSVELDKTLHCVHFARPAGLVGKDWAKISEVAQHSCVAKILLERNHACIDIFTVVLQRGCISNHVFHVQVDLVVAAADMGKLQ